MASTRRLPVVDVATRRLTGEEEWLMGDKRGGFYCSNEDLRDGSSHSQSCPDSSLSSASSSALTTAQPGRQNRGAGPAVLLGLQPGAKKTPAEAPATPPPPRPQQQSAFNHYRKQQNPKETQTQTTTTTSASPSVDAWGATN